MGAGILTDYMPSSATVSEYVAQRLLHHPFSTQDSLSRYIYCPLHTEIRECRGSESVSSPSAHRFLCRRRLLLASASVYSVHPGLPHQWMFALHHGGLVGLDDDARESNGCL